MSIKRSSTRSQAFEKPNVIVRVLKRLRRQQSLVRIGELIYSREWNWLWGMCATGGYIPLAWVVPSTPAGCSECSRENLSMQSMQSKRVPWRGRQVKFHNVYTWTNTKITWLNPFAKRGTYSSTNSRTLTSSNSSPYSWCTLIVRFYTSCIAHVPQSKSCTSSKSYPESSLSCEPNQFPWNTALAAHRSVDLVVHVCQTCYKLRFRYRPSSVKIIDLETQSEIETEKRRHALMGTDQVILAGH